MPLNCRILLSGLALTASSLVCMAADDVPVDQAVSFESDLMPILKRRCAVCHITGNEPGEMALVPGKAYAYLVDVDSVETAMKRVAPGNPDRSYLVHKLQGTHLDVGGNGVRMPYHQSPLPEAQISSIRLWIEQGAKNN